MNKKKKLLLLFLLCIIIIGILGTVFINYYMINSTKKQIISVNELKNINNIDAILVLGCKAYDDRPSLMLSKRLEKGIDVYNIVHTKLLLSGDHGKKDYDEVDIMADYMKSSGVDTKDLFLDHAGFNTYDSIYRARYIFGAKRLIVITQKYHMYRALYLANKLDIETIGIVADDIPQKAIMLKNEIREIFSRDKNFIKGIIKPKSKYLGDKISLLSDGNYNDK